MRNLLILTLLFPLIGSTQSASSTRTSFDLVFMSKALDQNSISTDLNSLANIQHQLPLNYIGISLTSGFITNSRDKYEGGYPIDGYFEYLQIIPQTIKVQDSVNMKVNGFNFAFTLAGIDLIKSKKIDLITCLGFNTGRVWLNGVKEFKQKNPYFSPMLTVITLVCIGKISLQAKCGYDYDISNKNWKRKGFSKVQLAPLNRFKYQGLNLSFGIGYAFT